MKFTPDQFGGFEIEAENGPDMLWLAEMIKNIQENYKPFLSNFFRVEMESCCITQDGEKADDMDLEEVMEKEKCGCKYVWGGIEKIRFTPFGYYARGLEERIKKLND